jgi:hypothetical protein
VIASRRKPSALASETDITSISCGTGVPSAPCVSTVMEMCGFLHSSLATVPSKTTSVVMSYSARL